MAIPRVFIGSTCYDLKYIRGNLGYFVRGLGFEPVLSETGDVFYAPSKHTHDSCVSEVLTCQLFVLIIGGRFGGTFKDTEKSITNREYEEAVVHKIPVFTLIEQSVYGEHHVYLKNKANEEIDEKQIVYPAVDSTKIFDFIDEVRKASYNNAIQPFQDFSDIESYLKKQWSGLMFSFLSEANERERVSETLSVLREMNERIEMLSKQILQSVGSEHAKITIELYEEMLTWECVRNMSYWHLKASPVSILLNSSFRSCIKSLGLKLDIQEDEDHRLVIGGSGYISRANFENASKNYKELRQKLIAMLKKHDLTPEQYLKGN